MKFYNRYILTTTIVLLLTTVILTAAGINALHYYVIPYIIEAIIITECFAHFNIKARRSLNMVNIVFLGIFLLLISAGLVKILYPLVFR